MSRALRWLWLVLLVGCTPDAPRSDRPAGSADCRERIAPIESGFGSDGPHSVEVLRVANPEFPELAVWLYLPVGVDKAPLIVFGHGNGLPDPHAYERLLQHIASRGLAVVYPAHQLRSERHDERYRALWAGMMAASNQHRARLDLERVGFVGHSYGAGMLPWIARRALVDEGFGSRGALLLAMAPWYPLQMSDSSWTELPGQLESLVLSFEADEVTDHRIAIDLYASLPANNRTYLLVRSDARGGCELPADHAVPQTWGLGGRDDALDEHAIFRLFDALVASAFYADPAATRVAHGRGNSAQIDMGAWPDGTPVAALVYRSEPRAERPPTDYLFRQADREAWRNYPTPNGVMPDGAAPAP